MPMLIKLNIADARPMRHGSEFFWKVMLEKTIDGNTVTFAELDGACDRYQEGAIRDFLKRMVAAGYLGRSNEIPYRYSMLKRQASCPIVSNDGQPSKIGMGRQHMWNVMRRSTQGFTITELAINASTDDVLVTVDNAKKYVLRLQRAGMLRLLKKGKPGRVANLYLLPSSQNTGPKAPRIHATTLVYDVNTQTIKGDVIAEEERQ